VVARSEDSAKFIKDSAIAYRICNPELIKILAQIYYMVVVE